MLKYVINTVLALGTLSLVGFLGLRAPEMHANYIISSVGRHVVQLSPPSNHGSGGTGFAVITPTGRRYTLTNAHICRIAENGELHAIYNDPGRYVSLRVIEVSIEFDLCFLEGFPGTGGVTLAGSLSVNEQIGIIGHPQLEYLTLQRGYVTDFEPSTILIGDGWTEAQCKKEKGDYMVAPPSLFSAPGEIDSVCIKTYRSARTTVVVYGGNSGSPAVNFWGNLIGVLFAGNRQTNQGVIVPLESINTFLERY